ncbi:MAG: YhdP family protein [Vibrio sp.]
MTLSPRLTRIWQRFLWVVLVISVLWAVTATVFRIFLPSLDQYRDDIEAQILAKTGITVQFETIRGYWGSLTPAMSLKHVQVFLPNEDVPIVSVDRADAELDLFASIIHFEPRLANVQIEGLRADVSRWPLIPEDDKSDMTEEESAKAIKNVQNIFLQQFGDFVLVDSSIQYLAPNGDVRMLDIARLRWKNSGSNHKAEGLVSLAGAHVNQFSVIADFNENGNLHKISGDFFVSAQNIRISQWLTKYIKDTTSIQSGRVSGNAWLTLKKGKPTDALVELKPSFLIWGDEKKPHQLDIEHGVVNLIPSHKGWRINGDQFEIKTDEKSWPKLQFGLDWQKEHQRLNIARIDLENLIPLIGLADLPKETVDIIQKLNPAGSIEDIRVNLPEQRDQFTYSAKLQNGQIHQWDLLPGLNKLSASVTGDANNASVKLTLNDDKLPYGKVFQAPLNIGKSQANLVWQKYDGGWKLWADKIQVANDDLEAKGEFSLDFPDNQSPFLSIYAEADAKKAGETWRYLPTLALGEPLTEYLSAAIQGGQAKNAQILWYGALDDFPYTNHKGIFQAKVPLTHGQFQFDKAWPAITDLQLDLLFQNASMYLASNSATLMKVHGDKVSGVIPSLTADGHIEINAVAHGEGSDVRDYMMATPLNDSVGAALEAVQVSGKVSSEFTVKVPFDGSDPDVKGFATLKDNPVEVQTPHIPLNSANGRIDFHNDVVTGKDLKAKLFDQQINLNFKGSNQAKAYGVNINVAGTTDVTKVKKNIESVWLAPLSGSLPWKIGVDLQLAEKGFTYQVNGDADLAPLASKYPAPVNKAVGDQGKAHLQASGNGDGLTARVTLPTAKYQTDIDIKPEVPVLTASNLIVGKGDFKPSPIGGHYLSIDSPSFNADVWTEFVMDGQHQVKIKPADKKAAVQLIGDQKAVGGSKTSSKMSMEIPTIPMPNVVNVKTDKLTLGGLDWHKVNFNGLHRPQDWQMTVNSSEVVGTGNYRNNKDLSLVLKSVHIFVPEWDAPTDKNTKLLEEKDKNAKLVSDFDRQFHENMPNLDLKVGDLWVQGYKVGSVDMQLERQDDRLVWKNLDFKTGSNHLQAKGFWQLAGERSHSSFNLMLTGENNSDVMERFGINSGIQKASFNISTEINWDGSPWGIRTKTLNGNVKTEFEDGIISNVDGAARLLGMFSLDSIVRKMQLDFTGVFDKGITFDSIEGSGKITNGVFITNDLTMDSSAGDMDLKGKANLNTQQVDAEVTFTPDLTSSVPLVTAFAVTPPTAVAVFAITKVITPVIDVFTKVRYSVKGPFDAPKVEEISRTRGEYNLDKTVNE